MLYLALAVSLIAHNSRFAIHTYRRTAPFSHMCNISLIITDFVESDLVRVIFVSHSHIQAPQIEYGAHRFANSFRLLSALWEMKANSCASNLCAHVLCVNVCELVRNAKRNRWNHVVSLLLIGVALFGLIALNDRADWTCAQIWNWVDALYCKPLATTTT